MTKLAYLVKYALSSGIHAVDVSSFKMLDSGYLYGKWWQESLYSDSFKEGRDFSFDIKEAEQMFNEIKQKKLASLQKQMTKITNMQFKIEG